MADAKNPVATSISDQPKDSSSLNSDNKSDTKVGDVQQAPLVTTTSPPVGPTTPAIAPFVAPVAALGSTTEAAEQGFSGAKVQADQQALPSHKGEEVPMGGNPLDSMYKDPKRKNSRGYPVTDKKFTYAGARFAQGELIYLTENEAELLATHVGAATTDTSRTATDRTAPNK